MPDDSVATAVLPSTIIPLTHPQLNELQTERFHAPITQVSRSGEIQLTEAFEYHRHSTKQYLLAEVALGRIKAATRVAYCYTRGKVYEACETGDFARAHPNLCHNKGCLLCGLPCSQLASWMGRRDPYALYSDPDQFGIELSIPEDSDDKPRRKTPATKSQARSASDLHPATDETDGDPCGQLRMLRPALRSNALARRKGINRILVSAKKLTLLLKGATGSTFTHAVVDATGPVRVRIIAHRCDPSYHRILALWRRIEPSGTVSTERKMEPVRLYEWAFEGAAPLLLLDGAVRSAILAPLRGTRLTRTAGGFYRPACKTRLKALRDAAKAARHAKGCPRCSSPVHEMIDHCGDTIEAINARYPVVDWGAAKDPRLISIRHNRNNCELFSSGASSSTSESRYGPN